ncbi:uncharacterized protein Dana_GF12964, isoform C [Drosophila ananassae]|uniref:Uncharacterized protein, isoform B n=1 Tax=Drosophila ananassae TaxID=7217 RepID=A0A0P9BXK1_DROAN|nr:uncharacterized protein LOC6495808 isoform X1 [Drosophila ananassae]XP_032306598.1 uncharacterized protein LOC6495808 isoform X1 [Drosophila ananassae]KPU76221.1 uncharacterized protein Dana_GF12964, isoform B [Drosophila ananassae]KPU76222.1 uncharacterized protein Dana_GF12964, isoform C [Drosophila ananassae]
MGLVTKFFYCIELKFAVVIIGFVDIILSVLCGCYLPWLRRVVEADYESWTEATAGFFKKSVEDMYVNRFGYTMYVFLLVVLVLHVGACILLIVSADSSQKLMIAPYIATALMRFVLLLLIVTWIATKSFDCTTSYWLIGLSLAPAGYFWLTVVSWYMENDS